MTAKKKAPSKAGRPSKYTDELAEAICERIAAGESMRSICSEAGMPAQSTVYCWQDDNQDFRSKCARARVEQADNIFHGMADIEEKVLSDELDPVAARVVLSSRQWRAAKLAPKKYGEKLEVENNTTIKGAMTLDMFYAEQGHTEPGTA